MILVLESGSLGFRETTDGGGEVREDIGLPFSNLIPGERTLQSVDVGDGSGCTTGWFCRATRAAAAASLEWLFLGGLIPGW